MQTYIPKICSIFLLTNRCSNSNIQLCKQMFVTSVRGIYNTDLQLMIQGGTVMRNENNTITGRTCQISGNTSSRIHSGDISRNRRIVVRRQKIALVSVAFVALAIVICTFLSGAIRTQAAPSEISCKYYTSIEVQSGDTLWSFLFHGIRLVDHQNHGSLGLLQLLNNMTFSGTALFEFSAHDLRQRAHGSLVDIRHMELRGV